MQYRLHQYFIVFTLLFLSFISKGQGSYRFRNFTIADGLSQSSITSIIEDNVGTLWIGTQDGINRFDGKNFQVFTSEETKGLESENVYCSFRGKNNNLFFGTTNGLTIYSEVKETFKTITYFNKNTAILGICEFDNNTLFLATGTQGLLKYDVLKNKIVAVNISIPTKRIHSVFTINANELLISTEDKGSFIYSVKTEKTTPLKIYNQKDDFIINDIEKYYDGFLLATNDGLIFLNNQTKRTNSFLTDIQSNLKIDVLTDVFVKSSDEIYVSTANGGLISAKKKGNRFVIYQNKQDVYQENTLLNNEINKLYCDKQGILWLGTQRGLSSFNPRNDGFLGVGISGNLTQGLPSSSVWAFAEDKNAQYTFIACDGSVARKENATGVYNHFFLPKNTEEIAILCVYYFGNNQLLVGTTNGLYELIIFNEQSYIFKKIAIQFENPLFERMYKIVEAGENRFFIATKGGVVYYEHSGKVIKEFTFDPKQPKTTISPGVIRLAHKTMDGTYYFSSSSGGLCVLKTNAQNEFVIQPYKWNNQILKKTREFVSCIYQEKNTELWLGTSGGGLLKLNTQTGEIKQFTRKDGLPNNFVYGICADKTGHLWLSTNKGICNFSKTNFLCTNYSQVHGLMSDEFNTNAFFTSSTGEMYFGGIGGYNYFFPQNLNKKNKPLEVQFLKFKFDNNWLSPADKNAPFSSSFSSIEKIELKYNQRSFTIQFNCSELMNTEQVEYKYRLLGSDEGAIYLGNNSEIRFNALQPGEYTLLVYARKTGAKWSVPEKLIIEVNRPYWQKWWFILLAVLLFTYVIIKYWKFRINQAKNEQVRLEMKIVERTKEIRAQKELIETQKIEIENQREEAMLLRDKAIEKNERTEGVLYNALPKFTAEELVKGTKKMARSYDSVSVLFTDFVGFSTKSDAMEASELVDCLDGFFSVFDRIIDTHDLEKIKTIGDAYMCAGGVPVRNKESAINTVMAGLEIQDYMRQLKEKALEKGEDYWELRCGINTGEVVGGVIGTSRFAYDIWGKTVNHAQRMEMLGEAGKVTITQSTFDIIEPYFDCTFKGVVESKSKGEIYMYSVEGIKPELSEDGLGLIPNARFKQIKELMLYSKIQYYKAEREIMGILRDHLPKTLHYHSISHTKDVVRAVERYALYEDVTDEGLFLLKTAATYHDAGFVESYEKNEYIGARMAEEILPKFGYSPEHIERIKELIYVTEVPHKPQNKLEEIMCDADLDYLGRDDFEVISQRLCQELADNDKVKTFKEWDKMQVFFLTKLHSYFTDTAKRTRNDKKEENLQKVIARLEKDEYPEGNIPKTKITEA